MALDYFADRDRHSQLVRWSLATTSFMARRFPTVSQALGGSFLLNPHARKPKPFDRISPSRYMALNTKAGEVVVHLFGEGKHTIILSHGWGDSSHSLQSLIETCLKQGFQVAAIDHIGHGHSLASRSHLPAFIESLELLTERLEGEGHSIHSFIGHSMGGIAILNLPDSLIRKRKIVIIAAPVNLFEIMFKTVEKVGIAPTFLIAVLESISRRYGKTWTQLQGKEHRNKLHPDVTFIHDSDDRYAPFSDIENFVKGTPSKLIKTKGLGHRRIVSDTDVQTTVAEAIAL